MAADSQATESAEATDQTRHIVDKIWTARGLLLGYSGYHSVRQPLAVAMEDGLANSSASTGRWQVRADLCAASKPVLESAYRNFVSAKPEETAGKLAGSLLVTGHDNEGYWLLEIDHNNTPTFYTERGFHAIGSGSAAAQVAYGLMENYEARGRPVRDLRLLAYRTVDTAISVLATGVGPPVRLWASEGGAPFAQESEAELERLREALADWLTVERESLATSLGEGVDAAQTEEEPLPEPIGDDPGQTSAESVAPEV